MGSARVRWQFSYGLHNIEIHRRSLPSKDTLRGHSDSPFRGEGYIQCCVGVRLCDMYSNQELAEIHFMYGKADGNAALARRLYQERYPQRLQSYGSPVLGSKLLALLATQEKTKGRNVNVFTMDADYDQHISDNIPVVLLIHRVSLRGIEKKRSMGVKSGDLGGQSRVLLVAEKSILGELLNNKSPAHVQIHIRFACCHDEAEWSNDGMYYASLFPR
ncbi:hypothetical protein ANN_24863 [Periplaneta americana]|uniref:DUF4817 domain-containing protein n=1 Tax=Periplaneta americana TaxID=6978 RepID=A0ABQ8S0B7_PERAM|nr:hypothetical protein ANN_24863 [Periplaneta americana]